MARSRVDLFEAIILDRRIEKLSIRELADKHGVHRRTVRQALASAMPPLKQTHQKSRQDEYAQLGGIHRVEGRPAPARRPGASVRRCTESLPDRCLGACGRIH